MALEENQEPMYERLGQIILQAITRSQEVRGILMDFQGKGMITEDAVFNLLISLEELATVMDIGSKTDKAKAFPGQNTGEIKTSVPASPENHVDGRELSENEKQFEEFYRKVFDEKDWLTRAKLKF